MLEIVIVTAVLAVVHATELCLQLLVLVELLEEEALVLLLL